LFFFTIIFVKNGVCRLLGSLWGFSFFGPWTRNQNSCDDGIMEQKWQNRVFSV
jgi:hypothetical protein